MVRIYNILSHDFVYKNPYELLIFGENHDTNRMYELMDRNPVKLKMAYVLLATLRAFLKFMPVQKYYSRQRS